MSSPASKNVKKLYWLAALTNLWFITGSWLYFYRLYMSDRQIGVLDGLVFGIGLLAEIPSGALADLLGRKRQLQLGLFIMGVGSLVQGFAQSYWYILAGMIMFTIGMALVSGSDDALVYDSLEAEGKAGLWDRIVARKFQIMHAVTIASFLVGGLLYVLHFRLPFIMAGVGALAGLLIASTFKEVHQRADGFGVADYVRQNCDGMRYIFRRHMRLYASMAIVVLGVGYAFDLGVIKPLILDRLGFTANAQAVINAVIGVVAILALTWLSWLRKFFGEKRGLVLLALVMAIGFTVVSFPVGWIGLIAVAAIFVANGLVEPWLNDVVQREALSSHRATALSTLALLQKLPYVVLAPLAGAYSSTGELSTYLLGIGLCILAAVAVLLVFGVLGKPKKNRPKSLV